MDPFAQLGLTSNASLAELKARYLELAKQHHPDAGGTTEGFQQLKEAYQEALGFLSQPITCPSCLGKGKLPLSQTGFYILWETCQVCRGEGVVRIKA